MALTLNAEETNIRGTALHVVGFLSTRVTSCAVSDSRESPASQEDETGKVFEAVQELDKS